MYLIAVHGGAGNHPASDSEVKHALRLACRDAISSISNKLSVLDVVSVSISVLENEECLNAGYGSNLTIEGQVECDASIMDDQAGFGSVGAVSGTKNPIRLAHAVLEHSRVPDALGRIPPLTLVSHGADFLARQKEIPMCTPEALISPRSRGEWKQWKTRIERSQNSTSSELMKAMQDTVGAVILDCDNRLAAGVSSGGLLLKYPGRIGEAAIFGAGCWAQSKSQLGMACSISGAGEQIIRTSLAQSIAESLFTTFSQQDEFNTHSVLERILTERFIKFCGPPEPQAGVLLLTKEPTDETPEGYTVRLWCAFTTASMAIAYASSYDPKPKALILRQSPRQSPTDKTSIFITSLPLSRI